MTQVAAVAPPSASPTVEALVPLETALAWHRRGQVDAAAAAYEEFLAHHPGHADALRLLGAARRSQGRPDDAETHIRAALASAPGDADAWHSLGNVLVDLGRLDEACDAYTTETTLRPEGADGWYALGHLLKRMDRRDAAEDSYRRAVAASPDHVAARHNLANLLIERGLSIEGIGLLRDVIADRPDLAEAHFNLAMSLLRLSDYTTGFAEYEWRWQAPGFPSPRRYRSVPPWDGRPFDGRRLLVHAEQGLGDTIQFARFLMPLSSLGADITFEVPGGLVRLLKGIGGAGRVVAHGAIGDPPADEVDADMAVPLMSLPHRLGLTLGSIPRPLSYIAADPALAQAWAEQLGSDGRSVVGLCWRGNAASPVDRGRSLPDVGLMAPLAAVPGIRLVALQKLSVDELAPHDGPTGWKVAGLPFDMEHPGPALDTEPDAFIDTAAIIDSLDLVVTTDTAVAHLAGALGCPTWLMLRHVADWRWLVGRTDSPWYPTMRLFRQPEPGDWSSVVQDIGRELARRSGP